MKKKFANELSEGKNEYTHKRVDEDYFKGYVTLVKIKEVTQPWIVRDGKRGDCILDENYEWLRIYPDDLKYVITAMFDDKKQIVEWYFDMIADSGCEKGVPYMMDLYLDLVIKKDGTQIILDENELEAAYISKDITQKEFDLAYITLKEVQNKYGKNLEELNELTNRLYSIF